MGSQHPDNYVMNVEQKILQAPVENSSTKSLSKIFY